MGKIGERLRKFRMPTAFTILFILTFLLGLGQGLWACMSAPVEGFMEAADVIIFLLVIGGYMGVVTGTGAMGAGIEAVVRGFRGREGVMIPVLMCIFALGGTVFGMWEETMAFYLIIIPVFIAAGYDAVTGFAVICLGAGVGCLGSTINPFATGIASEYAGITIIEGLPVRVAIWAACLAVAIGFVMSYGRKVKADPCKSIVFSQRHQNEEHFLELSGAPGRPGGPGGSKEVGGSGQLGRPGGPGGSKEVGGSGQLGRPGGPGGSKEVGSSEQLGRPGGPVRGRQKLILAVFGVSFLGMVVGVGAAGWGFVDMSAWFLLASLLCWLAWGHREADFVAQFIEGAKDMLEVALIIGVTRGISVIMNSGGLTEAILNYGEQALQSLGAIGFTVLSTVFFGAFSLLVPSSSGLATLSMPIMASVADFAGAGRDTVITAFQIGSGLVNFITPTSGALMGALALSRIPYGAYLKWVWKPVAALAAVSVGILCISLLL